MKILRREQFSEAAIAIIMTIVAALVTLGAFLWQTFGSSVQVVTPTNYSECVAASGSRIQESYPEVCVTEDGERFTNPDQKVEPAL